MKDVSHYLHVSCLYRAQDQWLREIGSHLKDHSTEFRVSTAYYEFICHTCRRVQDLRAEDASDELRAGIEKNPQNLIQMIQQAYREKNYSTLWDRLISEDSLVG